MGGRQRASGKARQGQARPVPLALPLREAASSHADPRGLAQAAPQEHAPLPGGSPELGARRVELILQQLEALPTLSSIAVRVLELTGDDDSHASDVVNVISCDPALSAKVIKLCRCSDRGRVSNVTTVEKAVVMLGFEAVRSAVLSVQVFDMLDGARSFAGELRDQPVFDRVSFWHHSLAVACACEALAGTSGAMRSVNKADAFVSGLLHDLGVVTLHVLLPKTFDRVCQFAETQGVSIDQASRKIIGLDTHTAGRRLAEHWRLPHSLGDVLWLHGQEARSLPDLPHRAQIALVTLADAVARRQCITYAGHGARGEDLGELCAQAGVSPAFVQELVSTLHEDVAARAEGLGLGGGAQAHASVLLRAVSRANEALGRINASMRQRAVLAQRQSETLRVITNFHDSATPGGSAVSVMGKVVESASSAFGGGFFAVLFQPRLGEPWQFIQFSPDGRPLRSQLIDPPPGSTAVADLADNTQVSMQVLAMLPWLSDYLGDARDLRGVHLLPLRCGWGVNAVLLHDCAVDGREGSEQLEALGRTWAAAIAAGAQHEGAKRLGERLAESNRALVEAHTELARSQAMAALGEVAAGAAHEMNNPLTVISGRSQLLARTLTEPGTRGMAEQIVEQAHRLSNMITALRSFAEPIRLHRRPVALRELLDEVARSAARGRESCADVKVVVDPALATAVFDPDHLRRAIIELLRNALESEGSRHVELRVQIEPADDRLKIQVTDDGNGLTPHALAHAFDPFFSAKPAGRQPGLGLAQARRIVAAHQGQITLENGRHGGAVATIRLENWRERFDRRSVA